MNTCQNLTYGTPGDNEADKVRDGNGRHIRVRRSDGVIFDSITEAARLTEGADRSHISKACRGDRKYQTTGGYSWQYVDPPIQHSVKVRRSDGVVFDSLTLAGESVGRHANSIKRAVVSGGESGGYHWEYV